jgi:hypothetical protein
MIESLIDPTTVTSVIEVDTTGDVSEAGTFLVASTRIISTLSITASVIISCMWVVWAVHILNLLVVNGLRGVRVNEAVPGAVEFACLGCSSTSEHLNRQQNHLTVVSSLVMIGIACLRIL